MESILIVFWIILLVSIVPKTDSAIDDLMYEAEEESNKRMPKYEYMRYPSEDDSEFSEDLFNYKVRGRKEKFIKLQYDMVLQKKQYDKLFGSDSALPEQRFRRNAIIDKDGLWPDRTIPYTISDSFSDLAKLRIERALGMWRTWTCLTFHLAQNTDYNKIKFELADSGCGVSMFGMIEGEQYIYLSRKCSTNVRVVAHEIGHAIGLFHEQSRHDRDEHVTVNKNNIKATNEAMKQFEVMEQNGYQDFNKPYDYLSIMHYGKLFYSRNRTANLVTLSPKNESYLDIIGEVQTLSYYDVKIVCQLYNCSGKCYSTCSETDSFFGPRCRCMCKGQSDTHPIKFCRKRDSCTMPIDDYSKYVVLNKRYKTVTKNSGPFNHGTTFYVEWNDIDTCGKASSTYRCHHGVWIGNLPECNPACVLKKIWKKHYNICEYDQTSTDSSVADIDNCDPLDEYEDKENITLICKSDKTMMATSQCNNGSWTTFSLNCQKGRSTGNKANRNCKLCKDRKCSKHVKRKDVFKHGSEIYSRPRSKKYEMFRDEHGYLEKEVITHKQIDGQWENALPICIKARCKINRNWNVTIRYTNGSTTGSHVPPSYDVIVACRLNTSTHELRGFSKCEEKKDGTSKCTCKGGKLKVPTCKPKRCNVNDVTLHNKFHIWYNTGDRSYRSIKDNMVEHGTLVFMNCIYGYDLKNNNNERLGMATGTCLKGTLSLPVTCEPNNHQKETVVPATPGESVTLTCRYSDNVTWYREGKLVQSGGQYTLNSDGTLLVLATDIIDDDVMYACHYDNGYGRVTIYRYLLQLREPVTPRVPICQQPKEIGPCRGAIPKFFYNSAAGACKQFMYGGCQGNNNNFDKQAVCEQYCVRRSKPLLTPKDVCAQPAVVGRCRAAIPRYFYNPNTDACEQFTYSGCDGNRNNFETMETCERYCHPNVPNPGPRKRHTCDLPKEVGGCLGNFRRWYYAADVGRCFEFGYGGCQGNGNNFQSEELCMSACRDSRPVDLVNPRTRLPVVQPDEDICSLPLVTPCDTPRVGSSWYYDSLIGQCTEIPNQECNKNRNNFGSREECARYCSREKVCQPLTYSGHKRCYALIPRWTYSRDSGRCESFSYGGCGGSANNFDSEESCQQKCRPRVRPVTVAPVDEDICSLPLVTPCDTPRAGSSWYYDSLVGQCTEIPNQECNKNINNFGSREECARYCSRERVCQPLTYSTEIRCLALIPRWTYSRDSGMCESFSYGGCGGSANNFDSEESCQQKCRPHVRPVTVAPVTLTNGVVTKYGQCPVLINGLGIHVCVENCANDGECTGDQKCCSNGCGHVCMNPAVPTGDVCSMHRDAGSCGNWAERWYFSTDSERPGCQFFWYGGCNQGNGNNFADKKTCQATCQGIIPVTTTQRSYYDCRRSMYGCCADRYTTQLDSEGSNCEENRQKETVVHATPGESVTLTCRYGDNVEWYKEGSYWYPAWTRCHNGETKPHGVHPL